MAHTLEGIKGGGGSIKVGTTGTVSSLMTREMEQISCASQKQVSSRSKTQKLPLSVACGSSTPKRPQERKSLDAPSSSRCNNTTTNHRSHGISQKTKTNSRCAHRIPMLGPDDFPVDRSPVREKNDKRISNIVEVVDIKCGNPDKAWASPITSRLKKLGFSKLSESFI